MYCYYAEGKIHARIVHCTGPTDAPTQKRSKRISWTWRQGKASLCIRKTTQLERLTSHHLRWTRRRKLTLLLRRKSRKETSSTSTAFLSVGWPNYSHLVPLGPKTCWQSSSLLVAILILVLRSSHLPFPSQHMYFYEDYMDSGSVATNLNGSSIMDAPSTPERFVNAVAGPSRLT